VPIGVAFRRLDSSNNAANAVLTIKYMENGVSQTATVGLIATISPIARAVFVPASYELVASAAQSKMVKVRLSCQIQVNGFVSSAFAAGSAFSDTLPFGSYAALSMPSMTLSFDSNPGKDNSPQVVTIKANGAGASDSVPFISWMADTVLPGELTVAQIVSDPAGADLPNEVATISNISTRTLDLSGCTLQDEGGGPRSSMFPFPDMFQLASGQSVMVYTRKGTNTPTDLFMGRRTPIWNNDFDTAVIRNAAGDEVARWSYFNLDSRGFVPGQKTILNASFFVDQAFPSIFTGVILEDGDLVLLLPDPTSRSFSGNFSFGATGPGGVSGSSAPDDGSGWPLPGAPLFALLAQAGGVALVGATALLMMVDRTSALRANFPLTLLINDSEPGGPFASGGYTVNVLIQRK
jgi:hypothetical protein